jgi:protein transport protein SEC24
LVQVVSEIDDPFVPQPDDLLVNLHESRGVIDSFLDSLPSVFLNSLSAESAMGPALQAAFMVINPLGGKLLLFQAAVPSLGALLPIQLLFL